jgi:hypothetical protein
MAASTYQVDAWQEFCQIAIIPEAYPSGAGGGTAIEFSGITSEISGIDLGNKDMEGVPLTNGGRVAKLSAMGDESITLKMYPTDVLLGSGTSNGVTQLFHPQTTEDTSHPVVASNVPKRRRFGIVIQWAETLPANAVTLPASGVRAYRITIVNAYMTEYKLNYDDAILSAEVTFKWPPFNKAGTANKKEDSTDGSSQLAAAITTFGTMA